MTMPALVAALAWWIGDFHRSAIAASSAAADPASSTFPVASSASTATWSS